MRTRRREGGEGRTRVDGDLKSLSSSLSLLSGLETVLGVGKWNLVVLRSLITKKKEERGQLRCPDRGATQNGETDLESVRLPLLKFDESSRVELVILAVQEKNAESEDVSE